MNTLWRDARFGWRTLRRQPGFAAAILLLLLLGIGINIGVFSLLYSLYIEPFPIEDPDELVVAFQSWRTESGEFIGEHGLSYENYLDYRRESQTLEDLALFQQGSLGLTGGDVAEKVTGIYATANYFQILGVRPAQGRFLLPEENSLPDGEPVVVLAHGAWKRLFGQDPDILGSTVELNGIQHLVVGIGPEGFRGTELWVNAELWLPAPRFRVLSPYRDFFDHRDASLFNAVGRLAPRATPGQVEEELHAMSAAISEAHFKLPDFMGAVVKPFRDTLLPIRERDRYRNLGMTIFGGAVLILLLTCVTAANLTLVRGLERDREIAVRQAVGAGRSEVIRQLAIESLVLFGVAALLSLPVAAATLWLLWRNRPPEFAADAADLTLQPAGVVLALMLALLVGILASLVPALRVSRVDLTSSLKEGAASGHRGGWLGIRFLRSGLVVVQVALAMGALVGAGLFYQSVRSLRSIDLGFESEHLALMRVSPGEQGMDEPTSRDLYRRLKERLSALPSVDAVGLSENRLLRGAVRKEQVYPEGEGHAALSPLGDQHRTNSVGPGYFEAVGVPLVRGRAFDDSIPQDGPPVAVINQYMAESLWPGENAVGKRFRFVAPAPPEPLIEVIGVAANARYRDLHEGPQFFIYIPLAQNFADTVTLHVRTAGDPGEMLPVLRREARETERGLVVSDLHTMDFYLDSAMWIERFVMVAFGCFGALALALAVVGVWGVVSFTVRRKRRDLGICRALGAGAGRTLGLVLKEALIVVIAGVALGWTVAFFILPSIQGFLVEVDARDPQVYLVQAGILTLIALLASLVPALRSLRIEPMAVLRDE